jgi:putative endonuclease
MIYVSFINLIIDNRNRCLMNEKQYFVYIMTTMNNTVLYTGVTNDLHRRVLEHRANKGSMFTKKYKLYKLVYFESGERIDVAISREKQIKGGSRKKKLDLISSINPNWDDLFDKYFG